MNAYRHCFLSVVASVPLLVVVTFSTDASGQQPTAPSDQSAFDPTLSSDQTTPASDLPPALDAAPQPNAAPQQDVEPRKIVLSAPSAPSPQGRNFHYHDGFYLRTTLSFGRYGGGLSLGEGDAARDVDIDGSALDVSLLIGGTPSPGLSIGGGIQLGSLLRPDFEENGDELATRNVGMLLIGPFVDGFPKANAGWHFGGLVGLGGMGETPISDASAGFGGAAWIGYDTWVGPDWSVGGQLRLLALAAQGEDPAEHSASLLGVSLGLSVLYH